MYVEYEDARMTLKELALLVQKLQQEISDLKSRMKDVEYSKQDKK